VQYRDGIFHPLTEHKCKPNIGYNNGLLNKIIVIFTKHSTDLHKSPLEKTSIEGGEIATLLRN